MSKEAEAEIEKWGQDVPGFILSSGFFVTRDEHRHDGTFPLPDYPYLHHLLDLLCTEPLLVIPKSRQVMVTWTVLAYLLVRCLQREFHLNILQTKREEDAKSLMDRVHFMYDRLPTWIRKARPKLVGPKFNSMKLDLRARSSMMWGIPQGADVVRSNTVSIYFSDETDYQPESAASLRAAIPSLDSGQGIWVSTPALGGLMEKLVHGSW